MSFSLAFQLMRPLYKRLLVVFGIVTLALTLFVAISMIVTNVISQVDDQVKPLVGADVVIDSSSPLSQEANVILNDLQEQFGFERSKKIEISTNLSLSGTEAKLVDLWGVEDNYPLYGTLEKESFSDTPPTGVYVDKETFDDFALDGLIRLGVQNFQIEGLLTELPTASFNFFSEGRTIVIPYEAIAQTELTQLGSRVTYQTLLKTDNADEIVALLRNNELFDYDVTDGQGRVAQVASVVTEFNKFIILVLIVTFMLATTSIFIAVSTMFAKQQQQIALLKLLGQRTKGTIFLYLSVFLLIFFLAWLVSCFLGSGILLGLQSFALASDFIVIPAIRSRSLLVALLLGLVSFGVPLLQFSFAEPLILLQPGRLPFSSRVMLGQLLVTVLGFWFVYVLVLGGWLSGLLFILALVLVFGLVAGLIGVFLRLFVRFFSFVRQKNFLVYDGLRSIVAPGNKSVLMTIGLFVTMMLFVLIVGVSRGFLVQLDRIGADQPSLYILNVLPEDTSYIDAKYPDAEIYDVILSRIVSINGSSLGDHVLAMSGSLGEFTREFNVTSVSLTPDSYTQGTSPQVGEVSLDSGFAQRLGVGLGDVLVFFVQGRTFELIVTSLREQQRDGSGPFFFVQFATQEFASAPKTYFRLYDAAPEDKDEFKTQLVNDLGKHLSFVDTDQIIETVTSLVGQITLVIFLLVGCILLFVFSTLGVCLDSMRSLKTLVVTLYTYLGATRKHIRFSFGVEVVSLFGLAFILAALFGFGLLVWAFSFSDLLQWSFRLVLEIFVMLVAIFLLVLGMIWLFYRDLV